MSAVGRTQPLPCFRKGHVTALFLACITCCLAIVASASADSILCSAGSAAGKCEKPEGVAIDQASGNVYVADRFNSRIDVFGPTGSFLFAFGWGVGDGTANALQTCTTMCFRGIPGPGEGQLSEGDLNLAISNDPASPSYRSLFVGERDNYRVQRFTPDGSFVYMIGGGVNKTTGGDLCPIDPNDSCGIGSLGEGNSEFGNIIIPAVGPDGTLFVADNGPTLPTAPFNGARVQSFEPSGTFAGQLVMLQELPRALVADPGGGFYLGLQNEVRKYDSNGTEVTSGQFPVLAANVSALATDTAGSLLVGEITYRQDRHLSYIAKYSSSGQIFSRFGYDSIRISPRGAAVAADGDVVGAETEQDRVKRYDPPASGPLPCCLESILGNTKGKLKGGVNPEGAASTYHFEYVSRKSFDSEGGFSSPKAVKTPESVPLPADFELHDVEATIGCTNPPQPGCLIPDTEYRYRLVAKSGAGENSVEGQFETLPPFELEETWASGVGTDAGRIHATVNPLGIPATAHFEYVEDSTYRADVEAQGPGHGFDSAASLPEIDLGSGSSGVSIASSLSQLPPGATYHYRVVVSDSFTSEASPEHTFTTFPLPNPPSNSCPNASFRTGPSAALPDCRAYEMVSPVDKNGGDIKVLGSTWTDFRARLEQSSANGDNFAYSSVTAFADAVSAPWTSQYVATRHEGEGWSTHAISPPRESVSFPGTAPPFKWDVQYRVFSKDLSEGWLIQDTNPPLDACAPEGNLNLYRRDNATGTYEALTTAKPTNIGKDGYELELQGLSADGGEAVFRANGAMVTDEGPAAAKNGLSQLYMHTQGEGCGKLRLVSVLPNGKASTLEGSLGTFGSTLPGLTRGNPVTNAVSADGSLVFWSTVGVSAGRALYVRNMDLEKTVQIAAAPVNLEYAQATPDGATCFYILDGDLYEVDTAKAFAGEGASTLIGKGLSPNDAPARLVSLNSDASRIYFISYDPIGGEGEAGKPNLFLREDGSTRLVANLHPPTAQLPGGDTAPQIRSRGFSLGQPNSIANGVRSSADGSHLVFISAASLTGYDNTDANDERPALEIYLYDAQGDHLACISCNPSGARPAGRTIGEVSGVITRQVAAELPVGYNQFTIPRALSADGNRLFFESYEALLARDTNGKADVYEWQRASSQDECDQMGAELYVPSSGGCLSLISSGQSSLDSEIADISPDGSDVFIRTAASLLPQDPGQIDVYDARVDGGIPQPPAQPAACEGEACQGPLSVPNDPTPASSAFEGAGNLSEVTSSSRCRKGKSPSKGRCVAKKHSKKKHSKKKHDKRANDHGRATR